MLALHILSKLNIAGFHVTLSYSEIEKKTLSILLKALINQKREPATKNLTFKKNLVLPGTSLYNLEHAFCVAMH